jgi:hypothetical protein
MRRHPLLRRIAWLRRNRCSLLLAALCMMILINPLFGGSRAGHTALAVSLLITLVLACWALRLRRPVLLGLLAFALATAAVLVLAPRGEHWLRPVVNGAAALFTGIVTIALLRYVLDRHVISTDKVFGAVAAYVLIAFTFACLFMMVQQVGARAFYIAAANDPDGRLSWSEAMYFSFTVLTSTGFGEITPVTDTARSLIVIEQVLGVMYVAFLVARLANLYGRAPQR